MEAITEDVEGDDGKLFGLVFRILLFVLSLTCMYLCTQGILGASL